MTHSIDLTLPRPPTTAKISTRSRDSWQFPPSVPLNSKSPFSQAPIATPPLRLLENVRSSESLRCPVSRSRIILGFGADSVRFGKDRIHML